MSEFSKTIVIVEDNMANQFILKEMLQNFTSYPILCYDNGKNALDSLVYNPFIIFMDLHMPIMNGHDCCIELRKRNIKCPIIALTANSVSSERIKCLESGMDDFMLKPITLEDISIILQKYRIIDSK
jgi:CheY-like chemotaxis protein